MLRGNSFLRSLLDERIINAQIFSTTGPEEVVSDATMCFCVRLFYDFGLLKSGRKDVCSCPVCHDSVTMLCSSTNLSFGQASWGPRGDSRIFRLFIVAPIIYFWCSCMCLQYRHLTDRVGTFSLSSPGGGFTAAPAARSKFSSAKKRVVPQRNFNMQQMIMHGKMLFNCVLFLNGAWCIWGLNCAKEEEKKKKKPTWVKVTAQASERTL